MWTPKINNQQRKNILENFGSPPLAAGLELSDVDLIGQGEGGGGSWMDIICVSSGSLLVAGNLIATGGHYSL